ncbi:MAG TPA: hypothetical protein VKU19_07990 [Bryobacteraceae bacterium]|nr:hypothetical protein [Bryobacteraceae bacterium]
MSWWTRIDVFHGERLSREIHEELASHLAEAISHGRDPAQARKALGPPCSAGEEIRDIRLPSGLDSLRADIILGWRQLLKRKLTSGAAILSLALPIGSCTSAFRLIDALLLRPLPVSEPNRLYAVSIDGFSATGKPDSWESCSYPMFRTWRIALKNDAELIAISFAARTDLTCARDAALIARYCRMGLR